MGVLIQDDFNRADAASTPGSPQVGGPYTVRSGTWGISGNRLSGSTTAAQITFPGAVNIDFSYVVTATPSTSIRPGMMIRWADANNHILFDTRSGSSQGTIYTCVGGTYTAIGANLDPFAPVAGDVLRMRAYGPRIEVFHNGVVRGIAEDPFFGNGASAAGFRSSGGGVTFYDDLLAQTVDANPLSWGASPEAFDGIDLDFTTEISLTPSLYKGRDTALLDESETP